MSVQIRLPTLPQLPLSYYLKRTRASESNLANGRNLSQLKVDPRVNHPVKHIMSDFEEQLKQAIERGLKTNEHRQQEAEKEKLSTEELRRRHTSFRLAISERIEETLTSLSNQIPGFEYENIYGEKGWGGAVSRDELNIVAGRRNNIYSRLEMTVKPLTELGIVNLSAKGTVKNKEMFARKHHRSIEEAELNEYLQQVDRWVLEFAQLYAAAEPAQ